MARSKDGKHPGKGKPPWDERMRVEFSDLSDSTPLYVTWTGLAWDEQGDYLCPSVNVDAPIPKYLRRFRAAVERGEPIPDDDAGWGVTPTKLAYSMKQGGFHLVFMPRPKLIERVLASPVMLLRFRDDEVVYVPSQSESLRNSLAMAHSLQ